MSELQQKTTAHKNDNEYYHCRIPTNIGDLDGIFSESRREFPDTLLSYQFPEFIHNEVEGREFGNAYAILFQDENHFITDIQAYETRHDGECEKN